jgi:cytochrome c oxidase assembly protein subunit 15
MTDSPARPAAAAAAAAGGWLHRYATFVACCTFLLVIAGGLVTSTGSALAVPDWPLSFGQLFPRMEGGVLFEHGHRLIAASVGALTVVLALWASRTEPRRSVRALAWTLVGVVVLQGVFGGVTVLLRLPSAVSVAHAGLAQIFFALTVTMAAVTSPAHLAARPLPDSARGTRTLALAATLVLYVQILLGAIVRHTGAGLAIPDFPLAFGRLVPEFSNSLIMWQYAHRVGAFAASVMVVWAVSRMLRRAGSERLVLLPAALMLALLGLQVFLGALTIWSLRAVVPTTAHVATSSLLFASSVVLTVRTHH